MRIVACHYNLLPYHRARYRGFLEHGGDRFDLAILLMRTTRDYEFIHQNFSLPGAEIHRAYIDCGSSVWERTRKVEAILTLLQPDAILAVGGYRPVEMLATLRWATQHAVPIILCSESKRDDATRFAPIEWLKGRLVRSYDAYLVAGSPHEAYLRSMGVASAAIFQGNNAVDNHLFSEVVAQIHGGELPIEGGLKQASYFLANNRFIPRKNILRLVQAYADYRRSVPDPWALVLVGDGPTWSSVREWARENAVQGVVMPGFIQVEGVAEYYARAGCFIHPAEQEQWGLVVNEAMAAGLPVLVSRTAGSRYDLVEEGRNGNTFDPLSIEEIREALLSIHRAPSSYLESAGRRSKEIIKHWGPERFGTALVAALEYARSNAPKKRGGSAGHKIILWAGLATAELGE